VTKRAVIVFLEGDAVSGGRTSFDKSKYKESLGGQAIFSIDFKRKRLERLEGLERLEVTESISILLKY